MKYQDAIKNNISKNNFLRTLVHSLQWKSISYRSGLYLAGHKVGMEIISKNIKETGVKPVISEIIKLFSKMKIGKLKIKTIEEKKIILTLQNGVTASGMENIGEPVCFFEAGLIGGILEAKLKKNIKVNETMCGGLGDDVEEFTIKY